MAWTNFLPENVAKRPSNFVGPNVAGAIVQGVETGILISQSIRFWSRANDEPYWLKTIVAFVSVAAAFQTSVAFYNTWRVVVLGFGNWINVVDLQWPDRIQPALNCLMSAPCQAFLIWRCWNALYRRRIVLIPAILLLIATIVANVYITAKIFVFPVDLFDSFNHLPRAYITAFVLTAVLDMWITALMFWYLLSIKQEAVSRRFAMILGRLLTMVWEAAVPPAACAIAACSIYIAMSLENLWDVFFQSILGKLYVISFFVILNGRAELRERPMVSIPVDQSAGLARYWVPGAGVRVHLTTTANQEESQNVDTPTTIHGGLSTPAEDSLSEKGC